MSQQERSVWDDRFRSGDHADREPDPFLLQIEEYSDLFPPAVNSESQAKPRALDVACGAGRNTVWLAQQGWQVTACDISLEGLRRTKAAADEYGLIVDLLCQDLDTASFSSNHFDLLICFFYLQRKLFPMLKEALRSKGLLVYKTYTTDQQRFPGRPRHPMHLLQPQELLEQFRDFRVLFYQEVVKGRGVAQIIAQKP